MNFDSLKKDSLNKNNRQQYVFFHQFSTDRETIYYLNIFILNIIIYNIIIYYYI